MRIVFSCPSSHPAPRWLAHGLVGAGQDVKFFTSFAVPGNAISKTRFLPSRASIELKRRSLPSNLTRRIVTNAAPAWDAARVLAERSNKLSLNMALHERMIKATQSSVIKHIRGNGRPDLVVATGSMNPALADYCYSERIPLAIYLPQPVMTYVDKVDPSQSLKMLPQEKVRAAELMAASVFLASSNFVAESLRDAGLSQPILRHPLGFSSLIAPDNRRQWLGVRSDDPFRPIFVGRAGEQKGLPYLFDAIAQISRARQVQFTVVSRDTAKMSDLAVKYGVADITTVLSPMPRAELFQLFQQRDVLVLPSIFEGYGLVVVEALANGLPVVATPLTAATDLGIDGKAGSIVEAKSTTAIVNALLELIDDRHLHTRFSNNAVALTADLGWETYARSTALEVVKMLEGNAHIHSEVGAARWV